MRLARAIAMSAVLAGATLSGSAAIAEEVMTITAEQARLYFGGLYPNYSLFLKGVPEELADNWIDQEYYAVLDVRGGPEDGKSTIMKLKATSSASPQPEWCVTEGGSDFGGHGPVCIKTDDPKAMNQIRFKVKVQYSNVAGDLPADYQSRVWAEYPELPGRRESEVFGPVDLHIIKQ